MPELKNGFTTGSCAAAAAKSATALLLGHSVPCEMDIPLPEGGRLTVPIASATLEGLGAVAGAKKDSGDDPDATNGMMVFARAEWNDRGGVSFAAGEGVGTVGKKGLQVPPGEPAINPVPRKMIAAAVRELTDRGITITVSIPGGEAVARNTFNPRLGIRGGLSILGTTGIVRPYSHNAVKESLKCALDVTLANGETRLVLTAGNIGTRSARSLFNLPQERVIEAGNEWGFMLDCAKGHPLAALLIVGHPGKLAKLPAGYWDTHSSRSGNAAAFVAAFVSRSVGVTLEECSTVEGIFASMDPENRKNAADLLAREIAGSVKEKMEQKCPVTVALVDMRGTLLGSFGELEPWKT